MKDRRRSQDTKKHQDQRQTISTRRTRGHVKKLDEGRRTLRNVQEPHELSSPQLRTYLRVSLVNIKIEDWPKPNQSARQTRRSSLTLPSSSEERKSLSSSVSLRVSEASRNNKFDGSSSTKSRSRFVRKNGQTLKEEPITIKTENRVSPVTRRTLSVTEVENTPVPDTRSSRKRTFELASNIPPSKRSSRIAKKRRIDEKENFNSSNCSDCGRKTGRLSFSHIGAPICDACESVRQSQYGNVQMPQKRCKVLLVDIKEQLGCVNQTVSYIVSGNNFKPLLNKKGTPVSVGKRFKCEIQSGNDGKFRQGGEPTKYRIPKLRIKRIQSVEEVNNSAEHRNLSRTAIGRRNESKADVSTRSGRIRRPTYKMRVNENIPHTNSLFKSYCPSTSELKSRTVNLPKLNVPSRRERHCRSSVKKPSIQSISSERRSQRYSNQKAECKSLPVNVQSRLSRVRGKAAFSTRGKFNASKNEKVNSVIAKSLNIHRHKKVIKIPYCCKTCLKKFPSTVEGKSHELTHNNKILKIILDKYIPIEKSTNQVQTPHGLDTGKCLRNLVWIPADIIKGDMMSSIPRGDNSDPILSLGSLNVVKEKESVNDVTHDKISEGSKEPHSDSITRENRVLEEEAENESGRALLETKNNNSQATEPHNLESTVPADGLEIQTLTSDNKDKEDDVDKPPEEPEVVPVNEPDDKLTPIPNTDATPERIDDLEDEQKNELSDNFEESIIDVGTEETRDVGETMSDLSDQPRRSTFAETGSESLPVTISGSVPERPLECVPETAPEKLPETTLKRPPQISSESLPETTLEEPPQIASESLPETTLEGPLETTLEGGPEIASECLPKTTLEGAPEIASECLPETTLEGAPEIASESLPGTTLEGAPEIASESLPETTLEGAPEMSSESLSETTLEGPPEIVSESLPEITLEGPPEIVSESLPEITSESASENVSECAPETLSEIDSDSSICITQVDRSCDQKASESEKLLKHAEKADNETAPESEEAPKTSTEEMSNDLSCNEGHKEPEDKIVESGTEISEQKCLMETCTDKQREDVDKVRDNTLIAGMVVESLMEQIFEGTRQDEEKKSYEDHKECSLNTIIETLSEDHNSGPDADDDEEDDDDDDDDDKKCNGDSSACNNISREEGKDIVDGTTGDVQKTMEPQTDSYLEPISDDETECFDSYDA